jgi:hypothetical protein
MIERTAPRRLTFLERLRITQCIGGAKLECGCVIGRYLTYSGDIVTVLDEVGDDCCDKTHHVDCVITEATLRARPSHA